MTLVRKDLRAQPFRQHLWTTTLVLLKVPTGVDSRPVFVVNVYVKPDDKNKIIKHIN